MGKKPYVEIRDPWCPSYPDHDGVGEFATAPEEDCGEQTPDPEDAAPPDEDYRPEIDLDELKRIEEFHRSRRGR